MNTTDDEKHIQFEFRILVELKEITYRGNILKLSVDDFLKFKREVEEYEKLIRTQIENELEISFGVRTKIHTFENIGDLIHTPYTTRLEYIVQMRACNVELTQKSYELCCDMFINNHNKYGKIHKISKFKTKEVIIKNPNGSITFGKKNIIINFIKYSPLGIKLRGYDFD